MLVEFIGCPASGKTTTAAMLFASLKERGIATEFVCEEARLYIARHRYVHGEKPHEPVILGDEDQISIMSRQLMQQEIFVQACGRDVVVVTDSSPLNSLFYMTPECRSSDRVCCILSELFHDHVFYVPPHFEPRTCLDPNRVHSQDQALEIDRIIPSVLQQYAPKCKIQKLTGNPQERLQEITQILGKL